MNDTLKELRDVVQRVLATKRPIREGKHAKGRARQHHAILRDIRARKRKATRHSRRVNRHRAGTRRSTRPPRR